MQVNGSYGNYYYLTHPNELSQLNKEYFEKKIVPDITYEDCEALLNKAPNNTFLFRKSSSNSEEKGCELLGVMAFKDNDGKIKQTRISIYQNGFVRFAGSNIQHGSVQSMMAKELENYLDLTQEIHVIKEKETGAERAVGFFS